MEVNPQPNQDLETKLIEKLIGVEPPEMSEVHVQSIYQVPSIIRQAHPQPYTPKTISIGPFHNPRVHSVNKDNNILWSMEDLKLKYLRDLTEIHFKNILAFEECHFPYSAYVSQYLTILGFLINTEKDVKILIKNGIIVKWMGDDSSVATMIPNLGKSISMAYLDPNYQSLCKKLNAFYKKPRNKYLNIYRVQFKQNYFNSPWITVSTSAAVMLLWLTMIQTCCSVWSVFNDNKTGK